MNLKPLLQRLDQLEQQHMNIDHKFVWQKDADLPFYDTTDGRLTESEFNAWCDRQPANTQIHIITWVHKAREEDQPLRSDYYES